MRRAGSQNARRSPAWRAWAGVVRLSPTVHGDGDHGFVPRLIQIARDDFGRPGAFFSIDKPASSAKTRDLVGWEPTQIGLIQDLEQRTYS